MKDFLPKIKEAEEALQKELEAKSPSELDIENVEDAGPYIEMVGLKLVLWLRTRLASHLQRNKITVNLGYYCWAYTYIFLRGFGGGGGALISQGVITGSADQNT